MWIRRRALSTISKISLMQIQKTNNKLVFTCFHKIGVLTKCLALKYNVFKRWFQRKLNYLWSLNRRKMECSTTSHEF